MSKVDWSLASIHATHAGTFEGKFTCWYMLEGEKWFYSGERGWEPVTANSPIADLIERPKQPQAWSGPEDGLPPVNTELLVVEGPACWEGESIEWIGETVTVKAVFLNEIKQNIVAVEKQGGFCDCFILECLAPIKTAEQIARDKRESAIRELMDIAQVDCRLTAARLVDAGFKREGK